MHFLKLEADEYRRQVQVELFMRTEFRPMMSRCSNWRKELRVRVNNVSFSLRSISQRRRYLRSERIVWPKVSKNEVNRVELMKFLANVRVNSRVYPESGGPCSCRELFCSQMICRMLLLAIQTESITLLATFRKKS